MKGPPTYGYLVFSLGDVKEVFKSCWELHVM